MTTKRSKKKKELKENEAKLYLDLSEFITKNHLPFNLAEPILNFIKDTISKYDPKLIERTHISNTTISKIVQDCMGVIFKESLFQHMRTKPFSNLTDQSSEIYGVKYLTLLIRYLDGTQKTNNKTFYQSWK